jgi:hypothetical protein
MARHVFVEDLSIANIARAKQDYENTPLRARLSRYHVDVDAAFRGWNDSWLSPAFRDWNIEPYLPGIDCSLLLIQGRDDEYGTLAQLDATSVRSPAVSTGWSSSIADPRRIATSDARGDHGFRLYG